MPGNINLTDEPAANDPQLGPINGPNDITSAMAWTVDPKATTATITVFLQLQATPPPAGSTGGTANLAATISDDVGGSSVANTQGHFAAGQTLEYTITLTNPGPGNVTGAAISDPFPAGLTNIHFTAMQAPV